MLRWIANRALSHASSPEKQAERVLSELRMELYRAGQRVMNVQMRTDYYHTHLIFPEDVVKKGIERVSGQRKGKQENAHALRAGLKFTAELRRESQSRSSYMLRRRTAMSFIDPHDAQADDSHAPKIHYFSEIPVDSQFDDNVSALPSKHAAAEKAQRVS